MAVQNRYKPVVKARAESTDTTITVDGLPTNTSIISGYLTAKTGTGKTGTFIEEIKFTGVNTSGTVLTLTGCLRGLQEYGSDVEVTANKKPLPAGTTLVMGPNQQIENNEAKLDGTNDFTGGDQDISAGNLNMADTYGLSWDSDNIRVFRDGDDLKLQDNNQAVQTLSQLASLSGSNDKMKISAVDTTEGYGAAKLLGGDGISATDSGAGNSTLTFAVDIAATNDLLKFTAGELDTNLTASKTEIDQLAGTTNIAEADTFFGATDATGAQMETLTDGSNADALHVHAVVVTNAGQGTRAAATASGTENIAHGLGKQPKQILIYARQSEAGNKNASSQGVVDDDRNSMCSYQIEAASSANDADDCIVITSGSDSQIADVSAWDATNFTLNWTKGGNGEALVFTWIALA